MIGAFRPAQWRSLLRVRARRRHAALWRARSLQRVPLAVDAALVLLSTIVVTLLIAIVRQYYDGAIVVMLYLFPVLGLASARGSGPAIAVASLGVLTFSWFFAEPLFSLHVADIDELLALLVLLVTGIVTGYLATTLRQRADDARRREVALAVLYDVTRAISAEPNLERLLTWIVRRVAEAFAGRGCALYLRDPCGRMRLQAACGAASPVDRLLPRFAEPADVRPTPTGAAVLHADSAADGHVYAVPLHTNGQRVGILGLALEPAAALDAEASWLLAAIGEKVTLALEREALQRDAVRAQVLQKTDELKSALLSSVSHDLRSPLAAIKTTASSLLQEDIAADGALRREFAQTIVSQAERLDRLVENLLSLSCIEAGVLRPRKELRLLSSLVYDVLAQLERVVAGHRVAVDLPDDLPPLAFDYVQMGQVLTNLIENAVKYSDPGSGIRIAAQAGRHELRLSVADQGIGVPPDELERIFERFYRGRGGRRQGLGLGLAICRGIVEAHGGQIWAESSGPGQGTVVHLTLPLPRPTRSSLGRRGAVARAGVEAPS